MARCMNLTLGGVGFCKRIAISAMMDDEVEQEHGYENCAKSHHDRGAGGSVELHAQITTERRNKCAHRPADCQARADAIRKEHRAYRRHDEVAENEKNAGDGDRRGDDEAEGGVEQEVPETDVEAEPCRFVMFDGDEEEFLAKDEVKNANCAVEDGSLAYFGP